MGSLCKKLSCGILIFNEYDEILGCHCTGRPFKKGTYDIPKGLKEETDKSNWQCVERELKEETGLNFFDQDIDTKFELGTFKYLKDKDLWLCCGYYMLIKDIKDLICKSMVYIEGKKPFPEVNGYKWVKETELDWFYKSLQPILKEAIKLTKKRWEFEKEWNNDKFHELSKIYTNKEIMDMYEQEKKILIHRIKEN